MFQIGEFDSLNHIDLSLKYKIKCPPPNVKLNQGWGSSSAGKGFAGRTSGCGFGSPGHTCKAGHGQGMPVIIEQRRWRQEGSWGLVQLLAESGSARDRVLKNKVESS